MVSRCALYLPVPGGLALRARARPARGEGEPPGARRRRRAPVLEALRKPAGRSPSCRRARSASACRARAWRCSCPLRPGARTDGLPGRRRARCRARPSPRRTASSRRPWPGRRWRRWRAVRLHRIERGEAAPRPRDADRARDPAQPLPDALPDHRRLRGRRGEPALLRGGRRPLRRHPAARRARWPLAIADVSGKGAPASILMASVHASLRALAGTAPPAGLMARLNRFLFENTQANRYVTALLRGAGPRVAPARLRQRRPRPAVPAGRRGAASSAWPRAGPCWA